MRNQERQARDQLNLASDAENKKGFDSYVSQKRKAKESVPPVTSKAGELATAGKEKAEVLNNSFALVVSAGCARVAVPGAKAGVTSPHHPLTQPARPVRTHQCPESVGILGLGPGSASSIRAPMTAFGFQEEPFHAGTGAGGWSRTVPPRWDPALTHAGDFRLFTARPRSNMSLGRGFLSSVGVWEAAADVHRPSQ